MCVCVCWGLDKKCNNWSN